MNFGGGNLNQILVRWAGHAVAATALELALLLGVSGGRAADPPADVFRIGFSAAVFGDVNENDASAAVRVWAQALAKERGIPADPQPKILRGLGEIASALTNRLIDAVNLTAIENWQLRNQVALQNYLVAVKGHSISEEYVVLVHRSSGIERLADLRGRKLAVLDGSRACLAPIWFDTILAEAGFGPAKEFCAQVNPVYKLTKAVLPVFFRQIDACLVTRSGFETMIELNPQTGQQLKILATSPPLVPVAFCFRGDYNSPVRQKLLDEVARWHTTPSGRQILTIFQSDQLREESPAVLDTAMAVLNQHQRLIGKTNVPPGPPIEPRLEKNQVVGK